MLASAWDQNGGLEIQSPVAAHLERVCRDWLVSLLGLPAQTEVGFHRSIELFEIGWRGEEVASYDDYLADFSGEFHDLRRDRRFAACLAPDSYVHSQELGQVLLDEGIHQLNAE